MRIAPKTSPTILLIEDDEDVRSFLTRFFERAGWNALPARDGDVGLSLLESARPEIVILDLRLPGTGGLELLRILRERDPEAAVIVLTGHGDIGTAVEAMHSGAANFLTKPVGNENLLAAVERAHGMVELRRQNHALAERRPHGTGLEQLGNSATMREIARQIEATAPTDSPVLLQGETGTGKSWTARLIHARSPRAAKPFVEVGCTGMDAPLLDAQLFGHEDGASPDAAAPWNGLLEIAEGGTLFLDEIGDLAPELQPKLRKLLETRRFRRVGGTCELCADVRLIAATNRRLAEDARGGGFRDDLYHRLAVVPLTLPPLRERSPEDIARLCYALIERLRRKLGRGPSRFSPEALAALTTYSWPGNARQLGNVLERTLILSTGTEEIRAEDLPAEIFHSRAKTRPALADSLLPLAEVERQHILSVLEYCRGNRARAARLLQISRRTLYNKLYRYGVSEPVAVPAQEAEA